MAIRYLHSQLWSWCCDHAILHQLERIEKYAIDWYGDDPAYMHIMEEDPEEVDRFCEMLCDSLGIDY